MKGKQTLKGIKQTCALILTHLHGDLANGPGGVVTHRDKLRVQIEPQDGHELSWRGANRHTGYDTDMQTHNTISLHLPMFIWPSLKTSVYMQIQQVF